MAESKAPAGERAYAINDPRAFDYDGTPEDPRENHLLRDYPVGHSHAMDTPGNVERYAADLKASGRLKQQLSQEEADEQRARSAKEHRG